MVARLFLEDAIDQIIDRAVAIVREATEEPDNTLTAVRTVVRGARSRPLPETPAIWVVPDRATIEATTAGHGEEWSLPIALTSWVTSDDPEEGGRLCLRLAARARTEVLRDRSLGLAHVLPTSTRSGAFEPDRRVDPNRNLYAAAALVVVRFRILEVIS